MEVLITFTKRNKFVVAFFLVVFASRITFYSPWLEDWDSVQYVLAIKNFSLLEHTPHPPGYPVYIMAGRFINIFINDSAFALTFLSILSGSALVVFYFLLAKKFMNTWLAGLTSVTLLSLPAVWLLSEVALTNIVGLFTTTFIAILIQNGFKKPKLLYFGAFLAGLSLGVRFAEYSVLCSLLFVTLVFRKKLVDFIKVAIYFIAGLLLWLVPTIQDTGLKNFIRLYEEQSAYIRSHDSIFAANITFTSRLHSIKWLIDIGFTKWFFVFLTIIFIYLVKDWRKKITNFDYWFLSTWLVAYIVPLLFIYNLEVPRHVLPLSVPVLLLTGKVANKSNLVRTLVVVSVFPIFVTGAKMAQLQHIVLPPTVAPAKYIQSNFNPDNTTVVSTFTYRQIQHYAPEFMNYYGVLPTNLNSEYLILEHNGGLHFTVPDDYQFEKTIEFNEDKALFPRVSSTKLFIYEKSPR